MDLKDLRIRRQSSINEKITQQNFKKIASGIEPAIPGGDGKVGYLEATVTLTASELGNSGTTPILIRGGETGRFLIPAYMIVKYTHVSTPYSGGQPFQLKTGNSPYITWDDNGMLSGITSDKVFHCPRNVEMELVDGESFYIGFDEDDTSGDGTVEVTMYFERHLNIIDLGF